MSKIPTGPYTLWINYGNEGWDPTDFPTLKEALEADRFHSSWVITKAVQYDVADNTPEESA